MPFLMEQLLRAEHETKAPVLDVLLPVLLPIARSVSCTIHAFLQQSHVSSISAHLCPPLAIAPAQVSDLLHGSMHVTRRCA